MKIVEMYLVEYNNRFLPLHLTDGGDYYIGMEYAARGGDYYTVWELMANSEAIELIEETHQRYS
jgi:hypothetical protein